MLRLVADYLIGGSALGLCLPQSLWLGGALFLLAGAWWEIRAWRSGPLPARVCCVALSGSGTWSACANDGRWSALELRGVRRLTPSIIRLRLGPPDATRGFELELAADALPREIHRRLRVRLAWDPRVTKNVGRILAQSSA